MAINCNGINPNFIKLLDDIEIWASDARTVKNMKDPMEAALRLAKTDFKANLRELMYDTESQFLTKYFITPSFITDGTVTPVSVMDHEACLTLMATAAWTDPNGPNV